MPETSTRFVGWCPICEHDVKVRGGALVHHGYRRPGVGYIIGDCYGAQKLPYEVSPNGRRRLLVMTQNDHEPRDANESVELGLYELTDEDAWELMHYEDFDTPADADRAARTDPAWA